MDAPHAILGLEPGASRREITRAYRKLIRRYPPDLNPERFARIHRAYDFLSSLENQMAEVRKDPEMALETLFPQPHVTLHPSPPTYQPITTEDLEPLLGPLRLRLLKKILKASETDSSV